MINKITRKNSVKIINDEYVIKKKDNNVIDTYNYLISRDFSSMPEIIKEDDNYIYYKYISDIKEPKEQKIIDLINTITLLHSKTTFYKEVDIDAYKKIYEDINNEINELNTYYNNLMDNIDGEIYMSPANYLIARNVSIIYESLAYSKENIDKWYKLVNNSRNMRVVMTHNNLTLDHYLKEDSPYLISWDKAKINSPIYDLVSLYKYNYLDYDFSSILKIYLKKYPLTNEEMLLFLTLISLPSKIIFKDTEYKRVLEVRRLIDYLYKTNTLRKEYRIEKQENKSKKE